MDSHAEYFWSGCEQRELRIQRCADCSQFQFFPRNRCRRCGGEHIAWQASQGIGTIYSVTRVERAPNDEFRALAPYSIALVDLHEGVRLMAHAAAALRIGDQARVAFFSHNNRFLPRFEPL